VKSHQGESISIIVEKRRDGRWGRGKGGVGRRKNQTRVDPMKTPLRKGLLYKGNCSRGKDPDKW